MKDRPDASQGFFSLVLMKPSSTFITGSRLISAISYMVNSKTLPSAVWIFSDSPGFCSMMVPRTVSPFFR